MAALDAPQLDYELRADAGELVVERAVAGWRASAGGSLERQENEYAGRAFVPNYRAKGGGAWLSLERTGAQGAFDVGGRWDLRSLEMWWRERGEIRHGASDWNGPSLGAGASLRVLDGWTVRCHAATAWRPPSAVELRADGLHHGTASIEKGDSSLSPERSWTGQFSLDADGDDWEATASAWGTRIDGYIGLVPTGEPVLTVRGAFPAFRYRSTDALLWGGDLSAKTRPWRFAEIAIRGELIQTRDAKGDPLPFSPVPRATFGVDALVPDLWFLREAKAGPRLDWIGEAESVPGDYAPPPPSVWLLGFEASANAGSSKEWGISISGRNLTNRVWRDPTDRLRYFAPRPGATLDARISRVW